MPVEAVGVVPSNVVSTEAPVQINRPKVIAEGTTNVVALETANPYWAVPANGLSAEAPFVVTGRGFAGVTAPPFT